MRVLSIFALLVMLFSIGTSPAHAQVWHRKTGRIAFGASDFGSGTKGSGFMGVDAITWWCNEGSSYDENAASVCVIGSLRSHKAGDGGYDVSQNGFAFGPFPGGWPTKAVTVPSQTVGLNTMQAYNSYYQTGVYIKYQNDNTSY